MLPLDQNSRAGHLGVLAATDCKTLLASQSHLDNWNALRPEIDSFQVFVIPELEYFLKLEETKVYPFDLSWEDIKDDVMLILHTSGSTGTFCQEAGIKSNTIRTSKTDQIHKSHARNICHVSSQFLRVIRKP